MDNGVGNSMHWADTGFVDCIIALNTVIGVTAYDVTRCVTYFLCLCVRVLILLKLQRLGPYLGGDLKGVGHFEAKL